jgi:alkylated DNA repair dioxygenase AlkB
MGDKFNQVIANWYDDNNDFIDMHSDCTRNMALNYNVCISTLSLYDTNNNDNARLFVLEPNKGVQSNYKKIVIPLYHGYIISLYKDAITNFKHGIPPTDETKGRRISLSFRTMI